MQYRDDHPDAHAGGGAKIQIDVATPDGSRSVDSRDLFAGEHEIGIVHAGETYRLRITRQGKLILNK